MRQGVEELYSLTQTQLRYQSSVDSVTSVGILDRGLVVCATRCFLDA